eukprot:CAMPEP_0196788242 /NCGR_PEP_ID=MMETSP1104-20130614/24547_1 /TAXON_ID=33652 /ORGANISM="Cafeteria sp., Strain Caron Lab Isolate" /LENGTH=72 /DNA_ID=CAMNT_0042158587 /DNA_START=1 /DNA_END=216 /DNA_ORIENTATION=-
MGMGMGMGMESAAGSEEGLDTLSVAASDFVAHMAHLAPVPALAGSGVGPGVGAGAAGMSEDGSEVGSASGDG